MALPQQHCTAQPWSTKQHPGKAAATALSPPITTVHVSKLSQLNSIIYPDGWSIKWGLGGTNILTGRPWSSNSSCRTTSASRTCSTRSASLSKYFLQNPYFSEVIDGFLTNSFKCFFANLDATFKLNCLLFFHFRQLIFVFVSKIYFQIYPDLSRFF